MGNNTERFAIIIILSIVLTSGCFLFNNDGDYNDWEWDSIERELSFNLTGAQAVGAAEIGGTRYSSDGRSSESYGLVKVLEDGTIDIAMEETRNSWLPPVTFIAVSPSEDRDLFIGFRDRIILHAFWDIETDIWYEEVVFNNFLHIREDGSYVDVISLLPDIDEGWINFWHWDGRDAQVPIVFDGNGRVYFSVHVFTSNKDINLLCQYDPAVGTIRSLTPLIEGFNYEQFIVSPDGRYLFVRGSRGNARFFRIFPVDDLENFRTVYYTSSQDVWVRGFIVSPDSSTLIINARNIRGMDGIIMVRGFRDHGEITYECIYDSNTEEWFNRLYRKQIHDDSSVEERGFFHEISRNQLYAAVTDGSDVKFINIPIISPDQSVVLDMKGFRLLDSIENDEDQGQHEELGDRYYFSSTPEDLTEHTHSSTFRELYDLDVLPVLFSRYLYWEEVKSGNYVTNYYRYASFMLSESSREGIFEDLYNGELAEHYYVWADRWYVDRDNKDLGLDDERIESYVSRYFIHDVHFSYGDQTGSSAYAEFLAIEPYCNETIQDTGDCFLSEHYKRPQTGEPGITFRRFRDDTQLDWLNFTNIGNLFYDEHGGLWGVLGGEWWDHSAPLPLKLLDEDNNRDLQVVSTLTGDTYMPTGYVLDGMMMYFRDAIRDQDGWEKGLHKMYRIDLANLDSEPEDVFANVPENGEIEILDFSLGGGYLYFTGIKGLNLVAGRINLETLSYEPFDTTYRLSNIQVYN